MVDVLGVAAEIVLQQLALAPGHGQDLYLDVVGGLIADAQLHGIGPVGVVPVGGLDGGLPPQLGDDLEGGGFGLVPDAPGEIGGQGPPSARANLRPFRPPPSIGRRENAASETPHAEGFRHENTAPPVISSESEKSFSFAGRQSM